MGQQRRFSWVRQRLRSARTSRSSTTSCSRRRRDADHDRGRSKHLGAGSGHFCTAHLGLGADTPSACAHHRAGGGLSVTARIGFLPAALCRFACSARRRCSTLLVAAHKAAAQVLRRSYRARNRDAFAPSAPLRKIEWVVYAKRHSAEPKPCWLICRVHPPLRHRQKPTIAFVDTGALQVEYLSLEGRARFKLMTLAVDEFIRRILIHILPRGLHRIRHYGIRSTAAPTTSHEHASCSVAEARAMPPTPAPSSNR